MLDQLSEHLRRAAGSMDVITKVVTVSGVAAITVHILLLCVAKSSLNKKRRRKQQHCKQMLSELQQSVANIPQDKVDQIGSLTASQLIAKIKSKELTPEEVLECYQYKAMQAHEKTNCLCEPVPNAKAAAADSLRNNGKLSGLPVSLKENLGLKGMDCTAGCARDIDRPYHQDCALVKVLRHQGAVPFVRTNIPQTMISWETSNPIFGLTTNPLPPPGAAPRTVGGSSGGEGALLAAHGSVLGFGSDIGGSLRIPASLCGICSLKPTVGRISTKGTHSLHKGQTCLKAAYGPMARDVDTLVLAMDAVMDPYLWQLDPTLPPIPFNTQVFETKENLTIGYFDDNGIFPSVPAMKRGVHVAKQLLEKQGHKLIEWKFRKRQFAKDAETNWGLCVFGDGGDEIKTMLKNDKTDLATKPLTPLLAMPKFFKRFLAFCLSPFTSLDSVVNALRLSCGVGSVSNWWKLNYRNQELQLDMINEWREYGFDAVLVPGLACPAVTVGTPSMCAGATTYCGIFNQVDFPAGTLPVTTATAEDEAAMADYPSNSPIFKAMHKGMKGSAGMPVNVQIATLPFQDELCLRVMKELETAVNEQMPEKKL